MVEAAFVGEHEFCEQHTGKDLSVVRVSGDHNVESGTGDKVCAARGVMKQNLRQFSFADDFRNFLFHCQIVDAVRILFDAFFAHVFEPGDFNSGNFNGFVAQNADSVFLNQLQHARSVNVIFMVPDGVELRNTDVAEQRKKIVAERAVTVGEVAVVENKIGILCIDGIDYAAEPRFPPLRPEMQVGDVQNRNRFLQAREGNFMCADLEIPGVKPSTEHKQSSENCRNRCAPGVALKLLQQKMKRLFQKHEEEAVDVKHEEESASICKPCERPG